MIPPDRLVPKHHSVNHVGDAVQPECSVCSAQGLGEGKQSTKGGMNFHYHK